ncbi:zinc-binding dehydrogenase [Aneurinibacillus sp. Ricciae_BoGa-3]|uniref:zinc-dependent alcohol dehydrogenase n=1 Tax=Aneurinibacillus sp. Ricciae_BoGa-3 TaxID=3022697 RepID=UPI002340DBBB|nr:zinc-binding dehydrogenase [Aneurinibacillus sp. Ricciae_BoGa-3]WCK52771.1 zinc-binding dehydrogenase [Aneurinibacillus sp. Ricciae_BoGa-3]
MAETMKAARFYGVGQPLRIDNVPIPSLRDDEVLVQVKAVGLCGSDIHIVYEGVTPTAFKPIILGHEPAGVIAKVGKGVQGWEIGSRVSVVPFLFCGSCPNCITGHMEVCVNRKVVGIQENGGLAEYIAMPAKNLVRLPKNVPFTVGAILTDAVTTPFHALVDRAALKPGESIAIYGAGGLGLHAVQIARIAGAKQIFVVDTRDDQLARAKKLGADITINPAQESPVEAIMRYTNGAGVDAAAEFIGLASTISQAVECLRIGGRAVVVGLGPEVINTLPPTIFVRKQLSLLGSYGGTKRNVEQLIELVSAGRLQLEESITHRFSLEEVNTALHVLHEKVDNPIRVVVTL